MSEVHLDSPVTYSAASHHTEIESPVVFRVILLTSGSIDETVFAAYHELTLHSPAHVLAQQVPWGRQTGGRHMADHQERGRSQKDLTEKASKFHLNT